MCSILEGLLEHLHHLPVTVRLPCTCDNEWCGAQQGGEVDVTSFA